MSPYSSYATSDPEVAEHFLSQAYLDVSLSLPEEDQAGAFHLADERYDAGAFRLDDLDISASVTFTYEPAEEFFVSRVNRGRRRLTQDGFDEQVGRGDVALVGRPGVETATVLTDLRQDIVTLRAGAMRVAAGLDPEGEELPTFTSVRPVSAERARTWRRTVEWVRAMLSGDPAIVEAPLVVGSTERLLAGLVLSTFPNSAVPAPDRRDDHDARASATVRRATGFIDSNADLDIGIGDIAAAARVTRRAVQLAFRRHLDLTPTEYLRRVRLDHAHRELLAAGPTDRLTVTEVAYRWGFSSPSRFAERYRSAFGVAPSETLRR